MADPLPWTELLKAGRRLQALAEDSDRLNSARRRFESTPPVYRTCKSGGTTLSPSPPPPKEEQERRDRLQRGIDIGAHRHASWPRNQFEAQVTVEYDRLIGPKKAANPILCGGGFVFDDELSEDSMSIVKKQWMELGIWNSKWKSHPVGPWKHEEPLEVESELETNQTLDDGTFQLGSLQPPRQRRKSAKELQLAADRLARRRREREASRPLNQFTARLALERQRIRAESGLDEDGASDPADINTQARHNQPRSFRSSSLVFLVWTIVS
ncbi:hypothetical protein HRG_006363 [Hirsutella rhossiliensis]|uniref:Uncharacterized protein n=1 Tax=Hirsutella rhossiliensis TaxID=111463 RepID=A0A9P8MXU0_9HYPO|nr:uncharacterized protein HRG_06363 [Hirsutella rhossiliensis]KAH0962261.1 hypothetical protein HRG_06363 [Hirsutella rhossiliensis]